MDGLIKLVIVFILIVVALRRKLFVGYTLFAAGLLTALLFGSSVGDILTGYKNVLISATFLRLLAIIVMITFLGRLLREIGYLDRLVVASRELVGGARVAAMALPLLVGLMPMPGGALMSAPLVARVLGKDEYPAAFAAAVNYWSRHVIEFIWPVYPGIILAAAITGIPIGHISLMNVPMTLLMLALGYLFLIRKIRNGPGSRKHFWKPFLGIISAVWPILLAISLYAVFPIDLLVAIVISILFLMIAGKPDRKALKAVVREAFSPRLLALVFGILSFQKMLEVSQAISSIPAFAASVGLSAGPVIVIVAFISGLLTGMLAALVGLSFPLLAEYLYRPEVNYPAIFLAFLSGYIGMILSPTHFCLILSNEYFKADLVRVYKIIVLPIILLFLAGLLLYVMAYPDMVLG